MIPNKEEQAVIRQAFQVYFDLFAATDACSGGVKQCARTDFRHLLTTIEETLQAVSHYTSACNPIVKNIVDRTFELLGAYTRSK